MPYYTFINGERYDGSLINNAKFRLKGKGDGCLSEAEAQQLWQQAIDGGRITEIEEKTLLYLLATFKWTEKAREWMEGELGKEVKKVSSYYKIMDGLRYDRAILEKAEELTQGQGDGRISQQDAQFLLPLFSDSGDIRIEEERALKYILEHYSWTDKAKETLLPKLDAISKESNTLGLVPHILNEEFQLGQLFVEIDSNILHQQNLNLSNRVEFPDAFRKALKSLLQNNDPDSWRYLVMNTFELFPGNEDGETLLDTKIRALLSHAKLVLLGELNTTDTTEDYAQFSPPPRGEGFEKNWIFGLHVDNFSDHFTYIIIPRDGKSDATNYAFN